MDVALSLLAVIVSLGTDQARAATSLEQAESSPDDPDSCIDTDTDLSHPVGSTWIPSQSTWGSCSSASCIRREDDDMQNSSGSLFILRVSCGVAAAQPPCFLAANKSASYPDCCEKIVCPTATPQLISYDYSTEYYTPGSVPSQKGVHRRSRRQIVFNDSKDDEELLPLPLKSATAFDEKNHEISNEDIIDWDRRISSGKQLKKTNLQKR